MFLIGTICVWPDFVGAGTVVPCSCPDGQYCNGDGNCQICSEGHFCINNNEYACDTNTIAPDVGSSRCIACPWLLSEAYIYANETHTVCLACDSGNFVVDSGGYVCKKCTGSLPYANETHSDCVACDTGAVYHEDDVCKECPDGEYPNEDRTGCMICDRGNFVHTEDGICKECSGATPYANAGHTQCVDCDSEFVNDGVCTQCGSGKYKSGEECVDCDAGYYCRGDGSKKNCPKGAFSAAGQSECALCPDGYTTESETTGYTIGENISEICNTRVKAKLKIGNDAKSLPPYLKEGRINKSVVKNR